MSAGSPPTPEIPKIRSRSDSRRRDGDNEPDLDELGLNATPDIAEIRSWGGS
jgi:hypothetical protein